MDRQPATSVASLSEQRPVLISATTLGAIECLLKAGGGDGCRNIVRLWLDRAWSDYNEQPATP